MSANTVLLDFSLDPNVVKNESQILATTTNIENVLRDLLGNLKVVNCLNLNGGLVKFYTSDQGAVITLRIYDNGLLTINIEYLKVDSQEPILSSDNRIAVTQKFENVPNIKRIQAYPIRRCTFNRYYLTSDDRLLEYDIDEMVFEHRSPFQKVQIVHSRSLGNMLVLDDFQNISEADLIYTESLMQRGKEKYAGKEIVILGGGDGALLYELLKENPKEVIMLEIDEVVVKACAKYMRSICGNVLDNMTGPNYKIIIGDCIKALEVYIKEERKFDYVFGDLTDVPISGNVDEEVWSFITKILKMAVKILKPDGKYMTHLIGKYSMQGMERYTSILNQLEPKVKFTLDSADRKSVV